MLSTYQLTHVCLKALKTPHRHINNIKNWIFTTWRLHKCDHFPPVHSSHWKDKVVNGCVRNGILIHSF